MTEVVPRAWTHLLGIVADHPIDPATPTPADWQSFVQHRQGVVAPTRMSDGRTPSYRAWEQGFDPASWLDRSINAARQAVFPLVGIDPLY